MNMKRIIFALLIVFIFVLTISIFIKPIVLFLAKRQLEKVFIDSKVSVRDCDLKPSQLLSLLDIEVNKAKTYDFRVEEISIQYDPFSILKRRITLISLKDVVLSVYLPQRSIFQLSQTLNLGSRGLFLVESLELLNLKLNLKFKDLNLKAKASSRLSLIEQLINYLDIEIDSLDSDGFLLEGASLKISKMQDSGELYINKVEYGRIDIEAIKGKVRLKDRILFLDSLSAKALGGKIQGDLTFRIGKEKEYLANLEFINLDLEKFVDDFNLENKFQITGSLNGAMNFKGKGFDINALTGDFSAAEYGGILVIKDTRFLENLARNSKQPLDILMESFKDYHYNTGMMRLYLDRGNLVLDMELNGEAGRRNLNITLHDFRLKRGGL